MRLSALLILFLLLSRFLFSQSGLDGDGAGKRGDFRVMFYNVENLFDPFDDSLTMDNEFLPNGKRHWTWEKYKQKSNKIAKSILAAGGWEFPDLIGLCEVENRFVLDGVFKNPYLYKVGYKIVHRDSPDHRGIDVALVYQPERFKVLDVDFLQLSYSKDSVSATREILYVKGETHTQDTLHVFVNHWPSRWGGQLESEHKRLAAARLLRKKASMIQQANGKAKIIIMGDFNDYPDNRSIRDVLGTHPPKGEFVDSSLYNLAHRFVSKNKIGSHKYQGKWGMLDQFIVSGALLNKNGILSCAPKDMSVFAPEFLLETDKTYFGVRPFRTFLGYKYHGGFSDHLPVLLDLWR